jgi:hypothetical protein
VVATLLDSIKRDPWIRLCVGLWIAYVLVISAMTLLQPLRSLTPLYQQSAIDFWIGRREPLDFGQGFYYLPASRILYSPFAFLGVAIGGLLWRLAGFGLLTLSAWRWAALLTPKVADRSFATILVLMIPASAGALRNGQFDAPVWPLMALAAAAVAVGAWWRAAALLGLALALKPTAIVAALLIGIVWPQVGFRLLPIAVVILAIPYANPQWAYVSQLYRDLLQQFLGAVANPGRKEDLANALMVIGAPIPYRAMTFLRVFAAIGMLALGLAAARRVTRIEAAFVALMLTVVYLLLFNPRTEGTSYMALALVAAPISARLALLEGRAALSAATAAIAILPGVIGLTPFTMRVLDLWLDPLLASIFFVTATAPRALVPSTWTIQNPLAQAGESSHEAGGGT